MGRNMEMRQITVEEVIAGIVTYNPDIKRLNENIEALSSQLHSLVIVDNGSNNIDEITDYCKKKNTISVHVICNKKNEGIASALAKIMEWASKMSYSWVLTLDQDSVIEQGLITEYLKIVNDEKYRDVAMVTCLIHDRNFQDKKYECQDSAVIEVPYCITSAAFTNVEKYMSTSGYDSLFFIDCVDFDICYLLRETGYRIVRINYNGLYHEVGHGENRRFIWKKIVVYHHKPLRIYYLSRNTIWMHKKHPQTFGKMHMIKKLLALYTRIVLYEDNKSEKMKSFWKGVRDARSYE